LQQALLKINQLKITVEVSQTHQLVPHLYPNARRLRLALVGNDRIGIVREVTQVLAHHAVNVENLETHTSSAPMSADILFHAVAELTAAASLDATALTRELERISNDLMVDITLDESISHQ
jgi:glycine cleavage system regulatory protein